MVNPSKDLMARVCPRCRTVDWTIAGRAVDPWEAVEVAFGGATVLERLPAVGAPGTEVLVCRPGPGIRLAWLPGRRWVAAAPDLFVTKQGRVLLITSPNPALGDVLAQEPLRPARHLAPVPG
jgi:hypothetical protein